MTPLPGSMSYGSSFRTTTFILNQSSLSSKQANGNLILSKVLVKNGGGRHRGSNPVTVVADLD